MFRALALAALVGSCVAPTSATPPTVSVSACQRDGAPVVNWYVVGRGHEVWLHSGSAPMMVANPTTTGPRRGELAGAWNTGRRTVDVQIVIDGTDRIETLWATRRCAK